MLKERWMHFLPTLLALGWGALWAQLILFVAGVLTTLFFPPAWQLDFNVVIWVQLTVGTFLLQRLLLAGHHTVAHQLSAEKRWPEALVHYQKSLRLSPKSAETYINLGNLYADQRQWGQAIETYEIALQLTPDAPEAHNNLGTVLSEMKQYDAAVAHYQQAVELDPQYADAWCNLGVAWLKHHHWRQACESLQQGYRLLRGVAWNEKESGAHFKENPPLLQPITSIAKLTHDCEQMAYLIDQGLLPAQPFQEAISVYKELICTYAKTAVGEQYRIQLHPKEQKKLPPFYDRSVYIHPCPAHAGPVINPDLDASSIQTQYKNATPQVVWVDHFLTPACQHELYTFCVRSTIWHDFRKEGGYLGSYLDDGFNCGLLHQVADELRHTLPEILGDLPLIHMWGYKYDSSREGIVIHADAAAVNVNFWVTPDEANLDPESGGMTVYDVAAPADWEFQQYNINTPRIHTFIEHKQGKAVTIPYRCNRAVIFNSSLFHATAPFHFKPDYVHRRINITFLYGLRINYSSL